MTVSWNIQCVSEALPRKSHSSKREVGQEPEAADRMVATLEDSLVVSLQNPDIVLPFGLTIKLLVFTQMNENLCVHTHTHTEKAAHKYLCSSFIRFHNCSIMEVTKITFSRQMDKLWYIQTMEYYATMKEVNSQTGKRHEVTLKCLFLRK